MAFKYLKTRNLLFIFIYSIIISNINSQNILDPQCSLNSIKYSIVANLSKYLENEKNIDGREIYKEPVISTLKTKKIGTMKELEFNHSLFDNIEEYDSYDSLIKDLQSRKLDAIVINEGYANKTQFLTDDLSRIRRPIVVLRHALGFQKDSQYVNSFNEFSDSVTDKAKYVKLWKSMNYGGKSIEEEKKGLTGENGTLNALYRLNNEPFAYEDENGEITGLEILMIYDFAKLKGYGVNLKGANTYPELIESLKNKSADVVGGRLTIKDEYRNEISYSAQTIASPNFVVVRYENLQDSLTWDEPYDSASDLEGQDLGVLKGSTLVELTNKYFPNSKQIEKEDSYDLFQDLIMDEYEGFLMDEPNAENFKSQYPNRITYFPDNYGSNDYGFAFQKNEKGKKLKEDFNEYLKSINFKEIYDKWNVKKTSDLTIDIKLDESAELINVGFLFEGKPLCFKENDENKGAEIELLYKFAKEKNYNINMTTFENLEGRISYIENCNANITGGWLSITDDRKEKVDFSEPFYSSGTVLVVRKDSKKDEIPIKILDGNYEEKKNNVADILVKFPKREAISSCVFPEKYNETITINCTISDLKDIDPYNEGFEYVNSSDKILITYSKLDVSNFINANKTLPEYKVITESDKSKKLCSGSPSPSEHNMTVNNQNRKNSSGLSTGGIIAITIPCGLALLGVAGFALMSSNPRPASTINNSNENINVSQNLPLNTYEIQQSVKDVLPVEKVQVVQPIQDVNIVQ